MAAPVTAHLSPRAPALAPTRYASGAMRALQGFLAPGFRESRAAYTCTHHTLHSALCTESRTPYINRRRPRPSRCSKRCSTAPRPRDTPVRKAERPSPPPRARASPGSARWLALTLTLALTLPNHNHNTYQAGPRPRCRPRPRALRPLRARRTVRSGSWCEPPYCPLESRALERVHRELPRYLQSDKPHATASPN